MEISFGMLRLPPDMFWSMTPCEWMAAFQGWQEMHGIKSNIPKAIITRRELDELVMRFPDAI